MKGNTDVCRGVELCFRILRFDLFRHCVSLHVEPMVRSEARRTILLSRSADASFRLPVLILNSPRAGIGQQSVVQVVQGVGTGGKE